MLVQAVSIANRAECAERWKEMKEEDELYYEKGLTLMAQWYQPHKVRMISTLRP